jgi:hypothetical protein
MELLIPLPKCDKHQIRFVIYRNEIQAIIFGNKVLSIIG